MRKNLYLFILLMIICSITTLATAQVTKVVIRGVVTAAIDKLPLPGAHVMLLNKDGRVVGNAIADMDGNYSMRVETRAGDNLVVSYTGMKKATIPVKGRMTINVVMQDETVMLEGATIVASKKTSNGMMDINERDLTTAMGKVSMADLEDGMTAPSVEDALQGRIAGLDIAASSGDPGAGMSLRIRGTTSMTGSSQPLIVVDGFPYDASVDDDFDFATADEEEYSQLLNISPDDIKEIAVLKDAAATALYGAKAANGVLLITTKRGTVSKPRISYTFKGTMINKPEGIQVLSGDEYTTLIQEALMNSGKVYDPTSDPEFAYDVNQPYYFYNYGQNTDWYDEITHTGFSQDHTASISGGGDKAQYRASIGYYNANSVVIGTGLNGANHCIFDHLSVSWSIDEAFSSRSGQNLTLQKTMLAEALNAADHQNYPSGTRHGYAATISGDIGSFHHNLLAHNEGRNWSLGGGLDGDGNFAGRMDIFNNVVYNWDGRTTDGGAHEVNFVNNYYKPGPATLNGGKKTALNLQHDDYPGTQKYYTNGNIVEGWYEDLSNPQNGCVDGSWPNGDKKYDPFVTEPFFESFATVHTAKDAYKAVLSDVGCTLPMFDDHDVRIVKETLDGTATYKGSKTGEPGLIDHQDDAGGWEDYPEEIVDLSEFDTDMDGLPNWWEIMFGTNPESAVGDFSDANADDDEDGYTNLEEYLNYMAVLQSK